MGGSIMASIINASTSGAGGVITTADASGQLELQTAGTTAITIDASQNVGIGTATPTRKLSIGGGSASFGISAETGELAIDPPNLGLAQIDVSGSNALRFNTNSAERMRIDSSGAVLVGTTTNYSLASSTATGFKTVGNGQTVVYASEDTPLFVGRQTNDGTLISLRQAGTQEGSISVSGTTVSYNGGHLSRWSQLENETTQVEVFRGTVLESVDAMCEWYKDGELLPNEQATKTIVSATPASKAVAGVFDMYDLDDEDNPYDFYVAQSGDFVIRVAAGTVVQNGDLLESAGDGTARVQADNICRSSTIAKVTSNYVSETYADGSFCVPCILMIG
jgi:hypothetical protein